MERIWGPVEREAGQGMLKNVEGMHNLLLRALEALQSTPDCMQSFFHGKQCCHTIA